MFESIVGNDPIKEYLYRAVERKMVGNSYLFAGPDGIGKSLFALEFARLLIGDSEKLKSGNHPDIHIYRPEGKIGMHSIDTMRQFNREVYLAPLEAPWKVFIIHDADRMLSYSANALLKTFEEPAQDSLIVLLSSTPENFLPTVLSRCRRVYFQPIEDDLLIRWLTEEKGIEQKTAEKYVSFAFGSAKEALSLCRLGQDEIRQLALKYLASDSQYFPGMQKFIKSVSQSLEAVKAGIEESARSELSKTAKENLTATQKSALEKEIFGVVATKFQEEIDRLLHLILSWYRDLHLLRASGSRKLLVNSDYEENLLDRASKHVPALEAIEKLSEQARLAIKRFVPVENALETLFLQI